MKYLDSCTSLIDAYDGFIVDLWGVVHDGVSLYDGITDTLAAIAAQGKPLVFLSNAPRRVADSYARLDWLGVDRAWYRGLVTSGEATIDYIEQHLRGKHAYFVGPPEHTDWCEKQRMIQGTHIHYTDNMDSADYLLCVGHEYDNQPISELHPMLAQALKRHLPLLCANPDMQIVTRSGWECKCAGEIAAYYKTMGGKVQYFGKPYASVYHTAIALLDVSKQRILAVGDNPDTDIAGANAQGLNCLLLTQGVLSLALRGLSTSAQCAYIAGQPHQPDFVAKSFAL